MVVKIKDDNFKSKFDCYDDVDGDGGDSNNGDSVDGGGVNFNGDDDANCVDDENIVD